MFQDEKNFIRFQEFWTTIPQKQKNLKIDFSFDSAHCASSIKIRAKLRGRGGGVNLDIICIHRYIFLEFVTWFLTVITNRCNYFLFCWKRWKVTQIYQKNGSLSPTDRNNWTGLYCECSCFIRLEKSVWALFLQWNGSDGKNNFTSSTNTRERSS